MAPETIEIEGLRFKVADEYTATEAIVEVFVFRRPFKAEEEAQRAKTQVEELLEGLGRWEDTIGVLRNLREGSQSKTETAPPDALHAEDVEVIVVPGGDRFKVILDLVDKSSDNRAEKPHLWDAGVWRDSLMNLPRWRMLQAVREWFR